MNEPTNYLSQTSARLGLHLQAPDGLLPPQQELNMGAEHQSSDMFFFFFFKVYPDLTEIHCLIFILQNLTETTPCFCTRVLELDHWSTKKSCCWSIRSSQMHGGCPYGPYGCFIFQWQCGVIPFPQEVEALLCSGLLSLTDCLAENSFIHFTQSYEQLVETAPWWPL